MASGGKDIKRGYSVRNSSEEWHELYCQPCEVEGGNVEAKSYCKDCKEYLCTKCSAHHKSFKLLRKHVLFDVMCMSRTPPIEELPCSDPRSVGSSFTINSTNTQDANPASVNVTHVKDIEVDGTITSSVLMSTSKSNLLIATHSKVAIIDLASGSQLSELRLSCRPCQVTRINDIEAAVSLPQFQKIVLLRTNPEISVANEINTNGECMGIAFNAEHGTFWGAQLGRIVAIDASGRITGNITTDKDGNKIFSDPGYITTFPGTSSMYVSDWDGYMGLARLVRLSIDGNVLATYSGDKSSYLHQVAVGGGGRGAVFVVVGSSTGTGSVVQLTDNCETIGTIIPDLSISGSLSYNEATRELYVGTTKGVIKVYKMETSNRL